VAISRCRNATSELTMLTFPILAAAVVPALTNPRLGKIKFVHVVADAAHHSRRPFRRHVTEIVAACLKTALKRSSRFRTREN
jgi:hypothetical protein